MSVTELDSCTDTAISRTTAHMLLPFVSRTVRAFKVPSCYYSKKLPCCGEDWTMGKTGLTLPVGCEPARGVCPSPRRGFYIGYTGSSVHLHQLNSGDTLKLLAHWGQDGKKKKMCFLWCLHLFFFSLSITQAWSTVKHHWINSSRFLFTYLTSTLLPTAGSTSLWPNLEADLKGEKNTGRRNIIVDSLAVRETSKQSDFESAP